MLEFQILETVVGGSISEAEESFSRVSPAFPYPHILRLERVGLFCLVLSLR